MGDISTEPSMEDILSSIKRIIAEEGDGAQTRPVRRSGRSSVRSDGDSGRDPSESVLELREAVADAAEKAARKAEAAAEAEAEDFADESDDDEGDVEAMARPAADMAEPKHAAPAASADTILSQRAAAASRGSLEALSRMIVRPETPGGDTLEGLVREMLRPMLRDWLDSNLPVIVERMVAKEIARITERD